MTTPVKPIVIDNGQLRRTAAGDTVNMGGEPTGGTTSYSGSGGPFTAGLMVLTSDGTATATTEGGNITDVTTSAISETGSTFSFQGITANHTIMFGTDVQVNADVIKHFGIELIQITAATEITAKSFIFERWDGAAWIETTVMAVSETEKFRYADSLFIRANSNEHIRFGVLRDSPWIKKLINAKNLYWHRIRIVTTITAAPVFEHLALFGSSQESSVEGLVTLHGNARYRTSLIVGGNVFGDSGGVTSISIPVGTGNLPTGWNHVIKNSYLNGDGDAVYYQFNLPRGIDTSMPIKIITSCSGNKISTVSPTMITSLLPIETVNNTVADPAGGITPVLRSVTSTASFTANAAAFQTVSTPIIATNKLLQSISTDFDISSFYTNDVIAIRIEVNNIGQPTNNKIAIWAVEIEGIFWTLGDRI